MLLPLEVSVVPVIVFNVCVCMKWFLLVVWPRRYLDMILIMSDESKGKTN